MPESATLEALEKRVSTLEQNSGKPWWRTDKIVPVVTAIITLVIPATTLLYQSQQAKTQLRLAADDQANELRMAYLNLITQPEVDAIDRIRVIRFLEKTEDDSLLARWAKEEMAIMHQIMSSVSPEVEKEALLETRRYLNAADSVAQLKGLDVEKLRKLVDRYERETVEIRARLQAFDCEQMGGTFDWAALRCIGAVER